MPKRTQISLNNFILLTLKRKFKGIANTFSVEINIHKYQASILDISLQKLGG